MTTQLLYLALVIAGSLFFQTFSRFRVKDFGVDTWRCLLYAREIRAQKFRWPVYIDHYIIKAKYSYPPLMHFLLSLLPNGILYRYNFLISPLFSIIENILLFAFVLQITNDPQLALTASILYACTAANIIENNNLNTRSFGQLLYFLGMMSLYAFLKNPSPLWFFCLSLMSFVIIMGHRFSLQIFTATIVVYGVLWGGFWVVVAYLLGFGYAIILTRGRYVDVFLGHVKQVQWHWRQNKSNARAIKLSFGLFVKSILLRNVMVVPLLYWLLLPQSNSEINEFFVPGIFTALVLAVLTTFLIDLRCFGEGYRYVAYGTGPIAFFLAPYFLQQPWVVGGFAALSLCIAIYRNLGLLLGRVNIQANFYLPENLRNYLETTFQRNLSEVAFASFPPLFDDYVSFRFANAKVFFHDNGLALADNCCDPFVAVDPENRIKALIGDRRIDLIVTPFRISLPNFFERSFSQYWVYTNTTSQLH